MKPAVGRVVYTIYQYQISEEIVGYLGKDSFIVLNFEDYDCSYEFEYEDYNKHWFTSFSKAKACLKKLFKENFPEEKFKLIEHKSFSGTRFWDV